MATDPATGTVKVALEGGLIRQQFLDDQDGETTEAAIRKTDEIIARLQAKHEPVLILSDYSKIGSHTQEARDKMKEVLGNRYFDRIAAFGVPASLRIFGQLIINVTGKKDRVKILETKDEAEAWLNEFTPAD